MLVNTFLKLTFQKNWFCNNFKAIEIKLKMNNLYSLNMYNRYINNNCYVLIIFMTKEILNFLYCLLYFVLYIDVNQ